MTRELYEVRIPTTVIVDTAAMSTVNDVPCGIMGSYQTPVEAKEYSKSLYMAIESIKDA